MARSTLEEVLASEARAAEVTKEYEEKIDQLSKEKAERLAMLREESNLSVKNYEQTMSEKAEAEISTFNKEQENARSEKRNETAEAFAQKEEELVNYVVEEVKQLYVNS